MPISSTFRAAVFGLIIGLCTQASWAGQDCGEKAPQTPQAQAKGLRLGQTVRDHLEQSGASVALVGRIGINLSEYGQRYSHLGLAFRDHVRRVWRVMHLFNRCGQDGSEIVEQATEKFYETDLFEDEALVVIPGYALQVRIRNAVLGQATGKAMHQSAYNLIAHPFRTEFQNSNQWILETLAASIDTTGSVRDRVSAQRWLQSNNFEPATIRIPNARRTAARLFSPHVRFSDHTQEEFEKQQYLVVTVDAVTRFLSKTDPQTTQQLMR